MNKTIKILSIVIVAIMLVASITTVVNADVSSTITSLENKTVSADKVTDFGGTIIGVLQVAGTIAAIVVLMVIGIKYMMGSAEEKAEYKKVMVPYIIGAVLLFAAPNIVRVVYDLAKNFAK